MASADFLHKNAETPLHEYYLAAGAVCSLSTNSEQVLEAARSSFLAFPSPTRQIDLRLRLWVDDKSRAESPWPKPYVRGMDHLVFAGFEAGNSLVVDLRKHVVIGNFSARMAADTAYWTTVIFPILITIVGASLGIAELHCASVARNGHALLLAGPSGVGKSTLALALAQNGWGFISDDRTLCSAHDGVVRVWGMPTRLKLRAEAAKWFPEWESMIAGPGWGEEVWFDPEHRLGLKRVWHCDPSAVIFLSRRVNPKFRLTRMRARDACEALNRELMAELPDAAAKRASTIEKLINVPCWLLEYGGEPCAVARQIASQIV
ncbi:MAG TPA: hypothetical protein VFA67_06010 [Candidatus Sulfotelmatobacter sp.]|nr:hypothetical protein [Candidatus Sulfotelmatobacter sp.]